MNASINNRNGQSGAARARAGGISVHFVIEALRYGPSDTAQPPPGYISRTVGGIVTGVIGASDPLMVMRAPRDHLNFAAPPDAGPAAAGRRTRHSVSKDSALDL